MVARGYEAFEAEDWAGAGDLLTAAAARLAGKAAKAAWFDAALAYKFARDWQRAYDVGKVAVTFVKRGAEEPAYWNLGTAATVLHDWETAVTRGSGTGWRRYLAPDRSTPTLDQHVSGSPPSRRSSGRNGCAPPAPA